MVYVLAWPVDGCHLCDFSARRRNPKKPNHRPPKENHPSIAPLATPRDPRLTQLFCRPACDLDLLDPAFGEETDIAAVGRPEGEGRALRAAEGFGFRVIKRAHPELDQNASRRGEGKMTSIGRHSDLAADSILRRQDEDLHQSRIGSR